MHTNQNTKYVVESMKFLKIKSMKSYFDLFNLKNKDCSFCWKYKNTKSFLMQRAVFLFTHTKDNDISEISLKEKFASSTRDKLFLKDVLNI